MKVVSTKILLYQTTFHQAIQRRSPIQNALPSDEIIPEINYFLITLPKIYKRYGSFVPGPMESRRRLGKRRMAYNFEMIQNDTVVSWSWWRYFREHDFTDWKWKPPRSISITQEFKSDTSQYSPTDWLLSIFNVYKSNNTSKCYELEISDDILLYQELSNLRAAIDGGSKEIIFDVCQNLNNTLIRCLRNGILCGKEIEFVIDEASQQFRKNILEADFKNSLCYSFYRTVWEELRTIEPKNSAYFISQLTITILKWLSKLHLNLKGQALVASIIQTLPENVIKKVPYENFRNILISWVLSWGDDLNQVDPLECLHRHSEKNHKNYISMAEEIISNIKLELSNIDTLISQHKSVYQIKILLCQSKLNILSGLRAIESAENFLTPNNISASNLAKVLTSLPPKIMKTLITDCSKNLCDLFQQNRTIESHNIKKYWLTTISQISTLYNEEFLSMWRFLDKQSESLTKFSYPELFINRWENQCTPEEQAHIRNNMQITNIFPDEEFGPWISLIKVIYKCYPLESHFINIGAVFGMLYGFGKVETLGNIILHMSEIGPRLSAEILEFALEKVIAFNPKMAWKIAMLSPTMKPGRKYRSERFPNGDYRTLRYCYCPDFILWMIRDSKINPKFIWKLLRIPIHLKYSPRYRNQPSNQPLHPKTEALIKVMAVAFANAERLSPRVAFRNVMQCWHHLCHHKTPIDNTIVNALIHSGITRYMESGVWVPESRKNWLFYLLEQVEDSGAVNQANQIVTAWNKKITLSKLWHQRESNVLRVGQID
ncbi:putative fungal specific transcription factor domain containing protein [Erysiphe necator]|uniref:Putative fungal specific transcription factor domain containing protein n=1 Tax=Uncinula necator TaxID=52586 RepID=A0A0B1P9Q2_UNCNE|nr:putative fungal specific transcription factor domain containing protein [Erysiphe necator]